MPNNTETVNNGDLYNRQSSIPLNLPDCVGVVGCGGVGSSVAHMLAMAGVPNLYLFDNDTIELHNLNRIPVPESAVGMRKTDAIAAEINRLRPRCNVICTGNFSLPVAKLLKLRDNLQWIIATTDTLASRRLVYNWAINTNKVRYIEAAAEGENGSATGEPATFYTPDELNPGYASTPVWVSPCISSALMAVSYVVHDTPMDGRALRQGWENGNFHMFDSAANSKPKQVVTAQ